MVEPLFRPAPHCPAALRDPSVLRGINQHATERFMHLIAPHPETGQQGRGALWGAEVQLASPAAARS